MQIPAMVGKYELLEFLGGGMSHVYRARDTVIERPVVVKLLTPQACQDAEAKARFLQEARLAGNIQHDNIVSVFDFGDHDGRPFIVMEYLQGEDLREAIRGGRTGSLVERMKIALQIADALDYVHGRGIVHRDIKPENIHIDPNGRVKLMDFGIAKTADLSLTRTGMTMGTPYYMAPEQIAGTPATPSVDIYAFGMVFCELLTGVRAVNGDSIEAVLYQILHVPLDPAPMVNAGVPPTVRAFVLRCVEKQPENRPRNFREIMGELRGLIAETITGGTRPVPTPEPIKTVPLPLPQQRGRPIALWGVIGLLAVVGVGTTAVWMLKNRAPEPKPPVAQTHPPPEILGMVYIPAGNFLSGKENTSVTLPAFYIDETEVSNADFRDFCSITGCNPPTADPDLPVVHVTVEQARAFAAWKGKRLPSALEWERAARGTDGAIYPWGNDATPSLANVDGKALLPVKSYQAYRGIYQMDGNVWEMVDGEYKPAPDEAAQIAKALRFSVTPDTKWITMRGGSFNTHLVPGYEFAAIPEGYSSSDIGFRCAKSMP